MWNSILHATLSHLLQAARRQSGWGSSTNEKRSYVTSTEPQRQPYQYIWGRRPQHIMVKRFSEKTCNDVIDSIQVVLIIHWCVARRLTICFNALHEFYGAALHSANASLCFSVLRSTSTCSGLHCVRVLVLIDFPCVTSFCAPCYWSIFRYFVLSLFTSV